MTMSRPESVTTALRVAVPAAVCGFIAASGGAPRRPAAEPQNDALVVGIDSLFPSRLRVTLQALLDDPADYPSALTVTRDRVVIADARQALIRIFDRRSGVRIRNFGRPGDGPGDLRRPVGLQSRADTIFILDGGRSIVAAYDTTGKMIREQRFEGAWSDFVSRHNDGEMLVAGLRRGDIDAAGNIDEPSIVHEMMPDGGVRRSHSTLPQVKHPWAGAFRQFFAADLGSAIVSGSMASPSVTVFDKRSGRQSRTTIVAPWLHEIAWPATLEMQRLPGSSTIDRLNRWYREQVLLVRVFAVSDTAYVAEFQAFDKDAERRFAYVLADTAGRSLAATTQSRVRVLATAGDTLFCIRVDEDGTLTFEARQVAAWATRRT